jgi:hypothetical protein
MTRKGLGPWPYERTMYVTVTSKTTALLCERVDCWRPLPYEEGLRTGTPV